MFVDNYYLVRLTKIKNDSGAENLIGYAPYLPTANQPFILFSKGLHENNLKVNRTSAVQSCLVKSKDEILFQSLDSSYSIYILEEVPSSEVESFINESISKKNPAIDQFMAKLDVIKPKILN